MDEDLRGYRVGPCPAPSASPATQISNPCTDAKTIVFFYPLVVFPRYHVDAVNMPVLVPPFLSLFPYLFFPGEMVQEALTGQTAIEQLTSGHISPFGDGQGFF